MWNEQFLAFQGFEATVPVELVAPWHMAVELWEKDSTAPNPFKVEKRHKPFIFPMFSLADVAFKVVLEQLVRLQLTQEVEVEDQELDVDIEGSAAGDHPSVVILNGLQIEDVQYVYLLPNYWPHIHQYCLGGDFLSMSKLWGCTQHPSKLPHWPSVLTTCAVE
jgi:hypothetical protein